MIFNTWKYDVDQKKQILKKYICIDFIHGDKHHNKKNGSRNVPNLLCEIEKDEVFKDIKVISIDACSSILHSEIKNEEDYIALFEQAKPKLNPNMIKSSELYILKKYR